MSGAKGRGVADIEADRLAALNRGDIEAATLTECLAVDFSVLMQTALPEVGPEVIEQMRESAGLGILKRMNLAAELLLLRLGADAIPVLAEHRSDTVRGWACFMIGLLPNQSIADRLTAIWPLADDAHFGVREWSWMALRPHLAADLDQSIALLTAWASDSSERIRRFATESIRPRGVWCAHLGALKKHPEQALPVLEALRADPVVYVQDSVANWLNDAAKDQPDWVTALCQRWLAERPDDRNTQRIVTRAMRSLKQKPSR